MSFLAQGKLRTLTNKFDRQRAEVNTEVFGVKVGLLNKLFGCGHRNISRPFALGKTAYRCCLECGARRQFNPDTLETFGNFYYTPIVKNLTVD
jgi:hypothetical protein